MPASEKKAILSRLPGFFFGPGVLFLAEVSQQVYHALLGDYQSLSREDARAHTPQSCMGSLTLTRPKSRLKPCSLHAFTGTKADSLTALVDQFALVVNETAALGPVQTLSLAVHSGNPAIGSSSQTVSNESAAIIDSLADAMRKLHVQHPWPPAYLTQGELLVLARAPITRTLAGVDPDHRDLATDAGAPVASSRGSPPGLQIAMCRHALAYYRPSADWALFLSPVGSRDRAAAQAWSKVLGPHHTKPFATVPFFFSAAAEALTARGKTFALEMLTNWYHVPGFVIAAAGGSGAEPSETWLNGVKTQRIASVMIFRRVSMDKDDEDGIQVIWHDPRYWGGYGSMNPDIKGDSVKLCLAYLEKIVSGETMGEMFPDPEDEEGFREMGLTLSE
ncbi:hypothetical protein B0T18DRAFT_391686 [Schizothecium vesticola]|uniref:Uncharacterized protein n=1 Tax=Schizothecium vesticola TaxID=314040 RepID=A0AA40ENW9_9PEZI|nr:hypothetical protein B0T18DRAFT_391686 [Schizothecium vesticola]